MMPVIESKIFSQLQGTQFVPSFPASSPWVTAVGGTTTEELFELGPEVMKSIHCDYQKIVNGLSGGGFSNYFPAPSYQKQAISNYFKNAQDLPNPSFYNITGRAYPDVSALR
jgi:tripeptidyl-peptidase-1